MSRMKAKAPALLMAAGCALIVVALAVEFLPGSSPGLGRQQLLLLGAGVVLAGVGVWLGENSRARLRRALSVADDDVILGLREILILAVVFGAACAIAEAGVLAFLRFGLHRINRVGPDVIWMSAIVDTLVLATLGIVLRIIGAAWAKVRTARVVTFVYALIALDTIIHRVSEADRASAWSKWVLVAGLALVVVRLADRVRARALGRRVAVAVATLTLVLTAGVLTTAGVREAWIRARLADAAADSPNILLIILDTVRAASLSLYGYDRPTTPNLERFAREGVVYELAIAPTSWTLPAHASIFTGRDPDQLSADWWIPLDDTYPTLAEVLSDAGYATAAFSANLAYANRESGLARGFARFDDYTRTVGEALRTSVMLKRNARRVRLGSLVNDDWNGRRKADHVSRSFLRWLDDVPEDRPFFAFLNYMDGHDPYHAPPPYDTLYAPRSPFLPLNWGREPSDSVIRSWTDWYDRSITYLDAELARLFDELRARGELDNTIVVVTADHGEHLGEYGYMRHGNTLYMPVLHVPLILRYPAAVPQNVRIAAPIPTRDLAATVAELAGVPHDRLGGRSLAWTWNDQGREPDAIYTEVREAIRVPARYPNAAQDLQSIIASGFQYIRGTEEGEELFSLTPDTAIAIDPAMSDSVRATMVELRRDLELRAGEVVAGTRANRNPR